MRTVLLLLAGAIAGSLLTLATLSLLSSDRFRSGPITGPVAIVRTADAKHGYLGVTFSNEPARSLYVANVSSAVPIDAPHLLVGDRVTHLNAHPVTTFDELQSLLKDTRPGDSADVIVLRDGQLTPLTVKLLSLADVFATHTPPGGPIAP